MNIVTKPISVGTFAVKLVYSKYMLAEIQSIKPSFLQDLLDRRIKTINSILNKLNAS